MKSSVEDLMIGDGGVIAYSLILNVGFRVLLISKLIKIPLLICPQHISAAYNQS